jgi:hypothetical protein
MKLNDNQRMFLAICPTRIEGIDGEPFRMTKKDWVVLIVMCLVMFIPFLTCLF